MSALQPFADHDVTECAVRITGAGDGLSAALNAEPVELNNGDTVYLVLKGTVSRVSFEYVKDTEDIRRVHTVRTSFGTIVSEQAARTVLADARRSVEAAAGVQALDGIEG